MCITDIHPGNMLLGVDDNELLRAFEEGEFSSPVSRKQISQTRSIYRSRIIRPKVGPMLLSDFGEARIGPGPHGGDIMPLQYRAPETLHRVGWSYPVDIWSVGLTVCCRQIVDAHGHIPVHLKLTVLDTGLGPSRVQETLHSTG